MKHQLPGQRQREAVPGAQLSFVNSVASSLAHQCPNKTDNRSWGCAFFGF